MPSGCIHPSSRPPKVQAPGPEEASQVEMDVMVTFIQVIL